MGRSGLWMPPIGGGVRRKVAFYRHFLQGTPLRPETSKVPIDEAHRTRLNRKGVGSGLGKYRAICHSLRS